MGASRKARGSPVVRGAAGSQRRRFEGVDLQQRGKGCQLVDQAAPFGLGDGLAYGEPGTTVGGAQTTPGDGTPDG